MPSQEWRIIYAYLLKTDGLSSNYIVRYETELLFCISVNRLEVEFRSFVGGNVRVSEAPSVRSAVDPTMMDMSENPGNGTQSSNDSYSKNYPNSLTMRSQ